MYFNKREPGTGKAKLNHIIEGITGAMAPGSVLITQVNHAAKNGLRTRTQVTDGLTWFPPESQTWYELQNQPTLDSHIMGFHETKTRIGSVVMVSEKKAE